MKVRIINKSSNTTPKYATTGSAGFDISSNEDIILESNSVMGVSTGLYFEIPEGFELQIRPRSGLALKNKITVHNSPGCVDSDFRGEVKVILFNAGTGDFKISKGDRIAQGTINKVERVEFQEVEELTETERGTGGFGSTGK